MNQSQRLDDLFARAKASPTVHSFEQTSVQFIDSANALSVKIPGKKTKLLSIKNLSIMFAITVSAVLSWFLLTDSSDPKSNSPEPRPAIQEKVVEDPGLENKKTILKSVADDRQKKSQLTIVASVSEVMDNLIEVVSGQLKEEGLIPPVLYGKSRSLEEAYQFPVLTEEEIAANHKQKKAMLKALSKQDKKQYAYIPSGTFEYEGKTVSVQAFYMQKTEVSNLEYRTFLFDLLIQGRKDEFLKAKPDQHQWVAAFKDVGKPYEDHYFSHKAYNDYPVVNVSREGAEMYCKWLSQELSKYVGEEKQDEYNDVRLPQRVEWVKAASVEGKNIYPWKGQYIRNSEGLVMANCTYRSANDTTTTDKSDNQDVLAPAKSYWPNEYGLYNMAGNAAEMVYDGENRQDPGTAGGGWRSSVEGVKILAPDSYKGIVTPLPTIGFRVVTTVLKK